MKEPPKLPLKILRWFCSEERLEELEGDLYEVYQEFSESRPRSASLLYWLMIFKSFRFYALKNSKQQNINFMTDFIMLFKHQIKLIFRQLWHNKTTTAISVAGLVIGLTGFISIYSLIRYEYSFNHHIPDKERIYDLYTKYPVGYNPGIPSGASAFLKGNPHQDIEHITQFVVSGFIATPESAANESLGRVKSVLADSSFFDVFSQYKWLAGNSSTALKNPFQVVLTVEQAQKYFKHLTPTEVIGKHVIYDDSLKTTISGIVSQSAGNSDFIFTDFISHATIDKSWLREQNATDQWQSLTSASKTWVKTKQPLEDYTNPHYLKGINDHLAEKDPDKKSPRIIMAKPLSTLHFDHEHGLSLYSSRPPADKMTLSILAFICIVLLLMAIFNFVNLEIAQGSGKAKEVGIKKVLGSNRSSIFTKFILQSQIITTISILIAIPLTQFCLAYFDDFLPDRMRVNYTDPHFLLMVFLLILVIGTIAGLYPAMRISGVSVGKALKANARMSFSEKGTPVTRRVLVSFQFISSQILIIAAISVFFQVRYMLSKDMGFKTDEILYVRTPWAESSDKVQLFYTELKKIPEITELNSQSTIPATNYNSVSTMTYNGENGPQETKVFRKLGDTTYLNFYDIELLAGRNVSPVKEPKELIVNETYVKNLGFQSPEEAIGIEINNFIVVGVMKDFHIMSLNHKIKPLMILYSKDGNEIAFKVKAENVDKVINSVTEAYRNIYPNYPARIEFLDETIKEFYSEEEKTAKLVLIATGLSILIAGLGLFGLISITVVQRTKEVGIRKILGAGIWSLAQVITKEFTWLLLIAFVISVPASYLILQDWLANFAYQISLGWWVYLLGGIVSILMAGIATGIKIYHAVVSNPVDSLRYE